MRVRIYMYVVLIELICGKFNSYDCFLRHSSYASVWHCDMDTEKSVQCTKKYPESMSLSLFMNCNMW